MARTVNGDCFFYEEKDIFSTETMTVRLQRCGLNPLIGIPSCELCGAYISYENARQIVNSWAKLLAQEESKNG